MYNSEYLLVVLSLLPLWNFRERPTAIFWRPLACHLNSIRRATWRWANENSTTKKKMLVVGIYPCCGQGNWRSLQIYSAACSSAGAWDFIFHLAMLEAKTVVKQCRPEKLSVRWRTDFWLELTRTKVEHTYMIARLTRELWSIYSGLPCDFCR